MEAPSPLLFIRLYLDEDVHRGVATALRLRGFDALSVHDEGRWGHSDADQLTHATANQRALFTFNPTDFLQLHRTWLEVGRPHWGIIVSEQLPVGEATHRLLRLLNHVTADEIRNQFYWLQSWK